jgi:hypothetical protein
LPILSPDGQPDQGAERRVEAVSTEVPRQRRTVTIAAAGVNGAGLKPMSCPHLKEVVMLFCQAYPVKKMVPLDRLASADPCLGGDFQNCPIFRELTARLQELEASCPGASGRQAVKSKEVSR